MGEQLDELDAAKKRLESQAGARRDMSEAEKKLHNKIRNSRMRRIAVKMREGGRCSGSVKVVECCFRRVKTGGRGARARAEIGGESQVPGL